MKMLNYISCTELREYCKALLKGVPEYFFTIPIGNSGLHYPDSGLGKGGLLVQVETSLRIAEDLYHSGLFKLTERELDLAMVALIMRDTFRNGKKSGRTADQKHPHYAADYVLNHKMSSLYLRDSELPKVVSAIRSHEGSNNLNRTGEEVLPLPKTAFEKFVNLCSFLSSRSYLETNLKKMNIDIEKEE